MTRDLDKVCNTNTQIINDTTTYRKCSFPMAPHVRLVVGRLDGSSGGLLVGLSVCYNFLKGQKVLAPCSYRGTCLSIIAVMVTKGDGKGNRTGCWMQQ